VLFIADCVICGFGRLGTWLGIDRWPVEPDLITLAKGITGGTLPLGAVIVAPQVAAPFFTGAPGAPVLRHGATYAGHPTSCAAAIAAMDIYVRDDLIERGRLLEGALADVLAPLALDDRVAEVRGGVGLLAAVELRAEIVDSDPGAVAAWQAATREAGVLVRALGRGLAVSPPLVVEVADLAQIAQAMAKGLAAVRRRAPTAA
jgi:adenosylmethionine-8-amino-7-oxononanoate aminotransferase